MGKVAAFLTGILFLSIAVYQCKKGYIRTYRQAVGGRDWDDGFGNEKGTTIYFLGDDSDRVSGWDNMYHSSFGVAMGFFPC